MNNSNKSHDFVRQNEKNVKKSQKHDANLQKNSTLYFQVGLILCLLASYGALELSFTTSKDYVYSTPEIEDKTIYEVDPEIYKIIKEVTEEPKKEIVKPKPKNPDFKIADDKKEIEKLEKKLISVNLPVDKKVVLKPTDPVFDITPIEPPLNIMAVQRVPVFPGCESETNNDGRRKCLADKLTKLVQRKFDVDVASVLGLSGKQKIYVSFKINKQGEVEIVETKANHIDLEKEANRVIKKIPTMEPGKNNNKPVEVSYMLPIQFNIL